MAVILVTAVLLYEGLSMKKMAVFLNLDDNDYASIKQLGEIFSVDGVFVTFVHYLNVSTYAYPNDLTVPFYPNEAQTKEIAKDMEQKIRSSAENNNWWGLKNHDIQCLSVTSPKRDAIAFLSDNNIDIAVCLTHEKNGIKDFFHSSFSNYLTAHASCNVLILRC